MDGAAPDTLSQLRAGRLAGLERLDLSCGLTAFPREIFALAESLEVLNLSGNALQSLPDDLPRLRRLRVLFCSDNRFTELPAVLGRCARLDIVGFKANRIEHVPEAALAPSLRWLILTDNRVEALPDSLGRCTRMQKLMLAGNRLRALPATLADCRNLELLRVSANAFETVADALPEPLLALPRLSWLALAGNPYNDAHETQTAQAQPVARIPWSALQLRARLGEGASGVIHEALWQRADAPPQAVAVKLFKGSITSDGLPRSEMAASIAAGAHRHIVGVEGRVGEHPDGTQGLVLRKIPPGFTNLAAPPSLASCTRDVYADGTRFSAARAQRIARGIAAALAHLHARGLAHGDLYAHNILVDDAGDSLLGDFGAASFLPAGDAARSDALMRMDRRALGWLFDELAERCDDARALDSVRVAAQGPDSERTPVRRGPPSGHAFQN
ncbi:leucine-rich repeat-containing protein kinase family protein [Methylibium sp.]|uniref:leucine-rich repeat-containing protein kinase family protein n=1 Tax=Methylibium sp. TaxID=2067992 RepID=UPI003D1278F8